MRTIIIDDDKDVVEFIASALQRFFPSVEIAGKAFCGYDGLEEIEEKNPDFIFLDIEMPDMNGLEMLKCIPDRNFEVIFITGYEKYAAEAFRVNAIDYIVKPIAIFDLKRAMEKAYDVIERRKMKKKAEKQKGDIQGVTDKKMIISTQKGIEYIKMQDIIRIEAQTAYSEIHLINNNKVIISMNLKETEQCIDKIIFFRVHKSHLVNLNYVQGYSYEDGGMIKLADGSSVEISKRKIEKFKSLMEKMFKPGNSRN